MAARVWGPSCSSCRHLHRTLDRVALCKHPDVGPSGVPMALCRTARLTERPGFWARLFGAVDWCGPAAHYHLPREPRTETRP